MNAVVIKRAFDAIGVGLLERALEHEGRKGCSPILCSEPVDLEPPYERFDSDLILGRRDRVESQSVVSRPDWVTLDVYASEEDVLSIGWMETVLRSLAVLEGPVAFELYGGGGSVRVRFGVSRSEEVGFRAGLLGHFPGLVLREVEDAFPRGTPTMSELVPVGPYHRRLSLLGREGASPLGLAARVISELAEDETGLFQVLLQPAHPSHDWHYNVENLVEAEVKAARLKLLGGLSSDFSYDTELPPNLDESVPKKVHQDVGFFATLARYATWSEDPSEFLQGMRVATGMVRFGNRAWRVLEPEFDEGTIQEMVTGRHAHRPGLMLTSREVATLVHIPNARTLSMLSSIEQRTGHAWTPLEAEGARLGRNEYAGETIPVVLPLPVRLRHTYILGATGSGKSKLLERLALDDVAGGLGLCVVDPHGDLCNDILTRLPEERLDDVVWVSFSESGLVPRWNPFRSKLNPGKVADDMARAFLAQAGTTGARMEHNFRMLAYVVHQLDGTLDDFAELAALSPHGEQLRERALGRIENRQVQRFLESELPKYSRSELGSVTNKLSRLLLDDQLGAMFRQEENEFDPRRWMDQGRVVLVNLSSGAIGADHARFVGSLLVSLIYRAALSRADTDERRAFMLYLDEFQQLQAATLTEILSEGRKYGLGAVLAHQERGQLGTGLAQAIGNAATKVVFRPGEDDLPYMRRLLGEAYDAEILRRQGVGEALVVCEGRLANLETELTTFPEVRDAREWTREYARAHYSRADEEVSVVKRRPRVYDTFGYSR